MNLSIVPKKVVLPLLIFLSLLVFTLIYWWGYNKPLVGIDDANIYFVYMKHLAEGHGLVWNIGGEKVEGFTSLLWTLTGALLYKISPTNFPIFLLLLGFTLSFFTIFKIVKFVRKLNNTEERTIVATDLILLLLLIVPRGFIEWNVLTLMETSLWTFLLTSTTLLLCKYYFNDRKIDLVHLSLMLVLINLTRPESITFNLLFVAVLFMMLYSDHGWKYSLRKTLVPLLSHMVSLGALIGWRIYYFGYPLPNTYYAKVSGNVKSNLIAGAGYLFQFFINYPYAIFLLTLLFFFCLSMLWKWKQTHGPESFSNNEKAEAVLVAVVFAGLAFPVLTGGDHFHFSRFYQPVLPLLCVAAINYYFWQHYLGITIRGTKAVSAVLVLAVILSIAFSTKSSFFNFVKKEPLGFPEFIIAEEGRKAAIELNKTFADCKEYPSIGSFATGGVGYMYKGKTIDLLGLNSTVMAHANRIKTGIRNHASFEKKAFWQLKPDVLGTGFGGEIISDSSAFVLYENIPGYRNDNFIYLAYKKIYDDEDFREAYIPALVQNKKYEFFVFGYYAKPFLESLNDSMYTIKTLKRNFDPHQPELIN